jgi:hypothetical protein
MPNRNRGCLPRVSNGFGLLCTGANSFSDGHAPVAETKSEPVAAHRKLRALTTPSSYVYVACVGCIASNGWELRNVSAASI